MPSIIRMSERIGTGYGNGWYTNCHDRYRIFAGARETKKSVDILGYEPIAKILDNDIRNILIVRQNAVDNMQSTFANLVNIIDGMGMTPYFQFRTNPMMIVYRKTGQLIVFRGFNNPTSQTSLKAKHGIFTDVYFEESSELKSFDDFRKVDGSIRIGVKEIERFHLEGKPNILQLTFILNPWNKSHWIYEKFFKGRLEDDPAYLEAHAFMDYEDPEFSLGFGKGLYLHKSTFRINEFRNPTKDENMAIMKAQFPEMYKVEGLGCWGNSTATTYPEFGEHLIIPQSEANGMQYAQYAIGIDTGLSNGEGKIRSGKDEAQRIRSATTMQLCGLTANYDKLVAIDEFFHSNEREFVKKTEPQLMREIVETIRKWQAKYSSDPVIMKGLICVYVDCADIGFRQGLELEARNQGLLNVKFIASTKMRIQTRVDFIRLLMAYGDFLVSRNCKDLAREISNSRHGENGEVREDFDDHAINANEYAWAPLAPRLRQWKDFKQH